MDAVDMAMEFKDMHTEMAVNGREKGLFSSRIKIEHNLPCSISML